MELTARSVWTMVHGMGFGALYLLACSGAFVALRENVVADERALAGERFLRAYLIAMAVLAWLTVLSGTYVIYPWYRAAVVGTAAGVLNGFPQHLLLSSPATAGWHTLGMEWKEHVAWLTPIGITMAAVIVWQYGHDLASQAELRRAVVGFVAVSFLAAAVAGFWGAMINKHAPVDGGGAVQIMGGHEP